MGQSEWRKTVVRYVGFCNIKVAVKVVNKLLIAVAFTLETQAISCVIVYAREEVSPELPQVWEARRAANVTGMIVMLKLM